MDDIGLEQQIPGSAETPGKNLEKDATIVTRNNGKHPQDDIEFEQQIPGIAVMQGNSLDIKHEEEDAIGHEE